MSVKYVLHQSKMENASKNKWYGRAVVSGEIHVKQLAEAIQERCTVTEPDILAVIAALVTEMKRNLQNGMRVILDGFGGFKVGITSTGAISAEDYSVTKNVKGLHIIFQPTVTTTADRKRQKTFLAGCKVEELSNYVSPAATDNSKEG